MAEIIKKIQVRNPGRIRHILWLCAVLLFTGGCVYFNTFYNARKSFNEAENARKESLSRGREVIQKGRYDAAIVKALKVVEEYPNTGYYDDALYVLGVSYYYTNQLNQSERRLRELLANFPESDYVNEATLYLAKTYLKQEEIKNATDLFEHIFLGDYKKRYKTESALALGQYYFDEKEYDKARPYFQAVRDSLGNSIERKRAQKYIADGLFDHFKFKDALGAYIQLLGMDPDPGEIYHAMYRSGLCSFRIQRINDGMDYLNKLIENEQYFDSLGVLKLRLAEGYELDGDLIQAENLYSQVADESKFNQQVCEANYSLGLIYQFDYDNLTAAKEYYDKAAKANRSLFAGQDAFQRSTDIGKLEEFKNIVNLDTMKSQIQLDDAAARQYELAELFWFNLDKPDSAINEMKYLIETFPTAYDAPKAYIALASMIRDYESDTAKSDSLFRVVLEKYPNSDYVPQAIEALNLKDTPVDSGYPAYYLARAEDYLIDKEMIDSAKYFYQYIVDSFPDSKYYLQSRFAIIWITENYESPGDSSLFFAYQEIVDSFPNTEWANEARSKLATETGKARPGRDVEEAADTTLAAVIDDELPGAAKNNGSKSAYTEQLQSIYIGPSGDTLPLFTSRPVQTRELFVYPTEAYYLEWEGDLYFQIKLDFSGEVIDYKIMTRSESPELNRRAELTVQSMQFDQLDVSEIVATLELQPAAEGGGYWFVYKYRVILPDHLR